MSSTLTAAPLTAAASSVRRGRVLGVLALPEMRWAVIAVGLFAVGGVLQLGGAPAALWWVAYLACYVGGGWAPGLAGLRALRGKTLDVDLLMVVAAIAAAAIGQVFDGALLIIIFATSGALEALATKRTQDSVNALLDLSPDRATLVGSDGQTSVVGAITLAVADVILVRPGERIAADGVVIEGSSDVDQASITGEPMPVVKTAGSEVFAGTMNGTGALGIRVSVPASDSVVARIVAMVEAASATKAKAQLFIEKIEQRYSVLMVGATVTLFVIPLLLGGDFQPTLLRAITFMIVASPCAVVLATMPPLLSAIANAGRHGVLVKSAVVMEQLATTDTIAMDKTGTLTEGHPELVAITALPTARYGEDAVLALAAAAEYPSQHPLGAAVLRAVQHRALSPTLAASNFSSLPGRGVQAEVDGHFVEVLAPTAVTGLRSASLDLISQAEAAGGTAVVVLIDHNPEAVLGLRDRTRADAVAAVNELIGLTEQPPVLLTGDNEVAARHLAAEVGIGDVRSELLPDDKVSAIQRLEASGRHVLLVGDGVNDAPAMAIAYLGVAMGRRGSDLALQTADAVVVRDELAAIPKVISLSRRARRVVVVNLVIAATVIVSLSLWDILGHLPLPLGVAGHEGSTVAVGLNGLRLLRSRAWDQTTL